MTREAASIEAYDREDRAAKYHRQRGFDPVRKDAMLLVACQTLVSLTHPNASVLELGAGSGLFTQYLLATGHFGAIYVTDGADAMLDIAQQTLQARETRLRFAQLNFTQPGWNEAFTDATYDAVTSSMAIHHAPDKRQVFAEVFAVLASDGAFVFADHVAGASPSVDHLIGEERWRVRGQSREEVGPLTTFLAEDARKQAAEGNHCESVTANLAHLTMAGFIDADCLWRDYWFAVFVARKG